MVFYKGANAKPLIAERSNIIPTLSKLKTEKGVRMLNDRLDAVRP
jgi:CTP:molybdopterin cytidylyltransferase MocA